MSLKSLHKPLASTEKQLDVLENRKSLYPNLPLFHEKLQQQGKYPLKPASLDILQVNIGKMCNQTCRHCHVDAGPDRKEIMTKETMQQVLDALRDGGFHTVDITGGAPEMNPHFRWFVEECYKLGKKVMVRCNLTIIIANKKYHDLPQFYADHKVEVVCSLPFYNADRTDRQRGKGVFEGSIKALKMLNEIGYGKAGSGLMLDLVYNPSGAFMPSSQASLESQFKKILLDEFGIHFNRLFAITNMPISRFLEYLLETGNYEGYMERISNAFNPSAVEGLMCRNMISVGWDGYIYDCDFNQMLELKAAVQENHISNFDFKALAERNIVLNQHCYGCTAGAGSSCGGATA
jgi:radical SAM/Cys-rich protein